ncbi:MAG: toprim domain-containing protein [Saccharofermentanales bacterium]
MQSFYAVSEEVYIRANESSLEEFLQRQGEELKRAGKNFRWARYQEITINGNCWYNHYEQRGGFAIRFVQEYFRMSLREAVESLLNNKLATVPQKQLRFHEVKENTFMLPPRASCMRLLYAYLINTRKIDREIVVRFIAAKKIFEDENYHNIVFAGLDETGTARFAQRKRVHPTKKYPVWNVKGSDFRYPFAHEGKTDKVYVFESPIDLMSFVTINKQDWTKDSYVALCGVSQTPLEHFLSRNKRISIIVLCLDNDPTGLAAMKRIQENVAFGGYKIEFSVSNKKDWNEDLVHMVENMNEKIEQNK